MSTKVEKIRKNELKELTKWKSEKKVYAGYLLIMMSLLSIVRCLDEFASSIGGSIQSWLVNEFIVYPTGVTYAQGLSTWSLISTAMLVFTIMAVFYLALSDRFGRKKILIISVFGMAIGMIICFTANSLISYLCGSALVTFFIATDVHGIYVMEIAPVKKRATFIQITAVFGQVGVFLVAVSRTVYTDGEVLNWRMLYLIPAIVGIICGILLILSARETDVFKKQRIELLSKPYEERKLEAEAAKREKKANSNKLGINAAFKYIFSNKQARGNILATIPQLFAIMAFVGYVESIMTTNGMSTTEINQTLLIAPISSAVIAILTGYCSDKLGRRPTAIITSAIALMALFCFIVSTKNNVSPYLIGVILGLGNGAFFRYGDTLGLQRMESVPTNIRAAVASAFGLIATVIATISGVVFAILVGMFEIGSLCLIWGGIMIGLSAFLNFVLVKETKGIDLGKIQ